MTDTKTVQAGERTQPTPGPWKKHNLSVVVDDGSVITHAGISTTLEVPVQHANARLIAAAPELLSALKLIGENFAMTNDHPEQWDGYKAAIAAIAKAEGRAR